MFLYKENSKIISLMHPYLHVSHVIKYDWSGLGFVTQWSRVWVLSGPLKTYTMVNLRAREISWGLCRLALTSILIKKKYDKFFIG